VLVGYALVAVVLTWPLARHATSHVVLANIAAFGDPWIVGWALAFETRALAGLPHGGIFHPTSRALFYGETAFGALPLFAPPYLLTGNPTLAVNTVFLGGLALTAWSLHMVVARWTGSRRAAVLSAWTFLACPFSVWAWGPSAINYVTLWYWPWIMLRAATVSTLAGTLALGALVFAQGLSSAYIAVGVVGPLLVLAVLRLARPATRRAGWRLVGAAAIAVTGWAIAFAPFLLMRLDEPDLGRQTLYPFFSRIAAPSGLFAAGEPSGIAPAALALIAAAGVAALGNRHGRRAAWRSGLVWAIVGLVLALPPRVLVFGHAIASPVGWLADAGVPMHAVRDNGRRGLAALIGLCVLVGVAWAECEDWLARARRPVGWLLAGLLAVGIFYGLLRPTERRPSPVPRPGRYPLFDARTSRGIDSPLLAALREPGGALLELPTAPGPIHHVDAMHRAQHHARPILNGFDGYWPARFPHVMALACRLPDPDALVELRRETGLEVLLVHLVPQPIGTPVGPYACPPLAPGARPSPEVPERPWDPSVWETIARDGRPDLALVARDGTDLLFRVTAQ